MRRTFFALTALLAHTTDAVCIGSEGIEINITGCGGDNHHDAAASTSQDYVLESGNRDKWLPSDIALRVTNAFCDMWPDIANC